MSKIDAFNVILERLRLFLDEEAIAALAELHRHPGNPPGTAEAAAGRLREVANQLPKTGPVLEAGLPHSHKLAREMLALVTSSLFDLFLALAIGVDAPEPAPVDDQHIAWEPDAGASAAAIPCDDGALESLTNALVCELCGGRLQRIDDIAEYYCPDHQCDWCGEWLNEFGRCQNLDCSRPTDEVWD